MKTELTMNHFALPDDVRRTLHDLLTKHDLLDGFTKARDQTKAASAVLFLGFGVLAIATSALTSIVEEPTMDQPD